MLAVKNSSVRSAAAGVGVNSAGRLAKPEAKPASATAVPAALTSCGAGSKSEGSALSTTVAASLLCPLQRQLFGMRQRLYRRSVRLGIEHKRPDLAIGPR